MRDPLSPEALREKALVAELCACAETMQTTGQPAPASTVKDCARRLEEIPLHRWDGMLQTAVDVTAMRAGGADRVPRLDALSSLFGAVSASIAGKESQL